MTVVVRPAALADLDEVRRIYNQGIADRCTLDAREKSSTDIGSWFEAHDERFGVLVAEHNAGLCGWASLNRYSPREAHAGVADLSIYVARLARRQGVGASLMAAAERHAMRVGFDKIVLMTFPHNREGRSPFVRCGFREIGIYRNQGRLAGQLVDIIAMEKLLRSAGSCAETR